MPAFISDPWLPYVQPDASCRARFFCFPYAGGSASLYHEWADALPGGVQLAAVQLPGRGARLCESLSQNVHDIVARVADALPPWLDQRFALFGHSMGALIAFELARTLRRRGMASPMALFVSGRRAPRSIDPDPPIHALPDEAFLAEMRALNGTPEELLRNPEMMELLLPTLRADFAVCETYTYTPEPPLDCPIHVFGGDADRDVSIAALEPWREETTAGCHIHVFPGDHFFIHSLRRDVLRRLSAGLERLL
jgi:medium-chain acyl-[acyl-carrier-protein] hydrolase